MKLIIAVIRPERLEAVQEALRDALEEDGHYRLTVQTVEGHGRAEGEPEPIRGEPLRRPTARHAQITIGVNDIHLEAALAAITGAARTSEGEPGDGKIFVLPLEECVRIRTGERGGWAI